MKRRPILNCIIVLLVGLLVWLAWPAAPNHQASANVAAPSPPPATVNAAPPAASPDQAVGVAPQLANLLAPITGAGNVSADPKPQAELPAAIAQAIQLLKAGDIPGVMKTLVKPEEWQEWRAAAVDQTIGMPAALGNLIRMATPDQLRQVMQDMDVPANEKFIAAMQQRAEDPANPRPTSQMAAQFLQDLEQVQNQAPDWTSTDGQHVRYPLDADSLHGRGLLFDNVEGNWYLYGPSY